MYRYTQIHTFSWELSWGEELEGDEGVREGDLGSQMTARLCLCRVCDGV